MVRCFKHLPGLSSDKTNDNQNNHKNSCNRNTYCQTNCYTFITCKKQNKPLTTDTCRTCKKLHKLKKFSTAAKN